MNDEAYENMVIFDMIKSGYSIDYGQLSICQVKTGNRPLYQVYCENYKYPEAKLYKFDDNGLREAVQEFLTIKKGLRNAGLRNSKRRNNSV